MILTDILVIAALAVLVVAWWARPLPRRPLILLGASLAALFAALAGVADDRWQQGVAATVAVVLLLTLLANRLRRAPARTRPPWVSGTLFTLMAAGAVAAIVLFPVNPLPKPSGPHPVGVRSFEVADASRPGLIAAAPGQPRRLLARVWYPAADVTARKPRPYFTEAEADHTARTLGALVGFPPFFAYVKHVATNSYEDAPLLAGAKDLPVVIYSHGYTSFLGQNTALMEHLASHGYVVFSLQHTYDSSATVFPNGDVAPADPELFEEARRQADLDEPRPQIQAMTGATLDERLDGFLKVREQAIARDERLLRSGVIWAADRIFLHDRLQAGAVPPAIREITAASRLDRVGEMGMSFGGATAGTVCMTDARCAAGVNLDGGDFPFQAFAAQIPVPFLMFHSDLGHIYQAMGAKPDGALRGFNDFSYESFAAPGEVARVQLAGARHLGFSDFSLFVRRPVRDPLFGATPAKVMIGAQNEMVRGFFDRYLRGQANGFPKPQLAAYQGWVTPLAPTGVRGWWAAKTEAERAAIEARIARARRGDAP